MSRKEHTDRIAKQWYRDNDLEKLYPEYSQRQMAKAIRWSEWIGTELYCELSYERSCIQKAGKIGGYCL